MNSKLHECHTDMCKNNYLTDNGITENEKKQHEKSNLDDEQEITAVWTYFKDNLV